MPARLSLSLLMSTLAITGCGDKARRVDNLALCRRALVGEEVVSAERATVAGFRSFSYGPGVFRDGGPLAKAFPDAPDTEQGLWCWTADEPGRRYTAWAVVAGHAEKAVTVGGTFRTPPSGHPVLP